MDVKPEPRTLYELMITGFAAGRIQIPALQRNQIWKPNRQYRLIDSIFRGFPCGAITLFKHSGQTTEYVIDGSQRLRTIWAFLRALAPFDNQFPVSPPKIKSENTDALGRTNNEETRALYATRSWEGLTNEVVDKIHQYKFAVIVLEDTDPDVSSLSFIRMNQNTTDVKDAEIRHAVYFEHSIYQKLQQLSDRLDRLVNSDRFFDALYLTSKADSNESSYNRFAHMEYLTEYFLIQKNPSAASNRRDDLSKVFIDQIEEQDVTRFIETMFRDLGFLKEIYGGLFIGEGNNPTSANLPRQAAGKILQEAVYAFLSAVRLRNGPPTRAQRREVDTANNLRNNLIFFNGEVTKAMNSNRVPYNNTYPVDGVEESGVVARYADSLSGQANAFRARTIRSQIIRDIINDSFTEIDHSSIPNWMKELVWVNNPNKLCGFDDCDVVHDKVHKKVLASEYHCSHKTDRQFGGIVAVDNLMVGHAMCNQRHANDRPAGAP